jgi:class 3 adenylate cyclase
VPIVLVAVFGFGALVALSVGLVLYLGLQTATENTSQLLKIRASNIVDTVETRLDATLQPVVEQALWIKAHVANGDVDLTDLDTLDNFMHGALAATSQLAGIGWVDPDSQLRRWGRDGTMVREDWSNRPDILTWIDEWRSRQDSSAWSSPLWTHTVGQTVVLHETALQRDDRFLGMLVQVVPIAELSRILVKLGRETSMVPFVLYDQDRVLAHPLLVDWTPDGVGRDEPLPTVQELGDPMLPHLRHPDEVPYFLRGMSGVTAAGLSIDDRYQVFLHRDIRRFGTHTWTVGVHFDSEAVVAGDLPGRIGTASQIGIALLTGAIAIALFAGRRMSRPIRALAKAAKAVNAGDLDKVPELPGSRVRELDTALESFRQMVDGLRERAMIRDVLGRFVPESIARTLLAGGGTLEPEEAEATVLFCDLQGFTALTERTGPVGVMKVLNEFFTVMVSVIEHHGGIVTQFQGDAILATFNVPVRDPEHAANALRAAIQMQARVDTQRFAGENLTCRIGINTGAVVAGAVGAKGRLSYTVHGDAVNLAARLEALNKQHGTRILLSSQTASRVQGFALRSVGSVVVRGQSQPVTLYELCTSVPPC